MVEFIFRPEPPKCIKTATYRLPSEMVEYIERNKKPHVNGMGRGSGTMTEKAKELLSIGLVLDVGNKIGWHNLIELANFFEENLCQTYVVYVLPKSSPQAQFIQNCGHTP